MDNLRLTLLIIGCLAVAGIYLWEIFYKSAPKKKTDILNAVDDAPDVPFFSSNDHEVDNDNYADEPLVELDSFLTDPLKQDVNIDDTPDHFNVSEEINDDMDEESDDALPLEMSVSDYEAMMPENQNSNEPDIFAALEEELYGRDDHESKVHDYSEQIEDEQQEQEPNVEAKKAEVPKSNQANEDILVLYITSPSHISFNGLSISKAADEVGMIYGHMNVFHHFGPGKLHSGQPLFSLANMHEPGSFDLGRMADLKTKGLAVFMYSPASIDASVVFELYLNTTQRLAELLGGKVRTSDNELLNNAAITSLREKAESLSVN
jgi:cell division protein ZipA